MSDIGSRHGRSFLGLSAQYTENFKVCVLNLGVIVMKEKNPRRTHIHVFIAGILDIFGLDMKQIYSISVDNGSNILKTSRDILELVAIGVENELKEDDMEAAVELTLLAKIEDVGAITRGVQELDAAVIKKKTTEDLDEELDLTELMEATTFRNTSEERSQRTRCRYRCQENGTRLDGAPTIPWLKVCCE